MKGRNVLIHTENDKDGFVDVQGTARVDIFAPKVNINSNQFEVFAKLDMRFLGGHIQLHSHTTDFEVTSGDVVGFMPIGSSIAGALMTDATKYQLYWPLS